jgi:hypothetical protein
LGSNPVILAAIMEIGGPEVIDKIKKEIRDDKTIQKILNTMNRSVKEEDGTI